MKERGWISLFLPCAVLASLKLASSGSGTLSVILLSAFFLIPFLRAFSAVFSLILLAYSLALPGSLNVLQENLWSANLAVLSAVLVPALSALSSKEKKKPSSFGSARFAQKKDLSLFSKGDGREVYLGSFKGRFLASRGSESTLIVAPTRSGKGVGVVIPTLLSFKGGVFVYDIKGENYKLSSGFREKELKQKVFLFSPTESGSAKFNPLSAVPLWPRDVQAAEAVAQVLVDPEGKGELDHWDLTAKELLTAAVLHVVYAEKEKSLGRVVQILSTLEERIDEIVSTEHGREKGINFRGEGRVHPVVKEVLQSLKEKSENERSSVVSTALRCLSLYRDPVVRENTSGNDFTLTEIIEAGSLYFSVPPGELLRVRPLARLLITLLLSEVTRELPAQGEKKQFLLMLDEFPTLGRLKLLESSLSYLAGYGAKAVLVAQDLTQIEAAYGREESVTSNCKEKVFFAPNRLETAKTLSEMVGVSTVSREQRSFSGGRFSAVLGRVNEGEQESARALLTPDEVMRLGEEEAIILSSGELPVRGKKIKYFESAEFRRRSEINVSKVVVPKKPPLAREAKAKKESFSEQDFRDSIKKALSSEGEQAVERAISRNLADFHLGLISKEECESGEIT